MIIPKEMIGRHCNILLPGISTQEGHCKDCCCAQSWAALGITEYTGKSIPEEIEALRERAQKAEAEAARWQKVAVDERFRNMLLLDDDGQKFIAAGITQCPKTCKDCEDDCDPSWCPSAAFWRQQAAAALGCSPRAWLI